jgi:hypothetical protein
MDPADIIKALLPPLLHVLPDAITSHHPNTCEYSHPMNKNKTQINSTKRNMRETIPQRDPFYDEFST